MCAGKMQADEADIDAPLLRMLLAAQFPLLPLAIPVPIAKRMPGEAYPWHWSIYRWLEGETATIERHQPHPIAATTRDRRRGRWPPRHGATHWFLNR